MHIRKVHSSCVYPGCDLAFIVQLTTLLCTCETPASLLYSTRPCPAPGPRQLRPDHPHRKLRPQQQRGERLATRHPALCFIHLHDTDEIAAHDQPWHQPIMMSFTDSRSRWRTTVVGGLLATLSLLSGSAAQTKTQADYFVHDLPGAPKPLLKMHAG